MKFTCIATNSNLININSQEKIVDYLSKKLYEIGEQFSLISYCDNFEKSKNILQGDYEFIFYIGTSSSIYNHNLKDNLSRLFGEKMSSMDATYSSLSKYCSNNNIVFSMQEEMEVMLPNNSIPLCSSNYYNNGFMYKHYNKYIIFLPDNLEFVKENYLSYILPLINDLISFRNEYQIIRCFGILEKDIRSLINDILLDKHFTVNIVSTGLDSAIYFRFDKDIDGTLLQNAISDACNKLNKFIYSTSDSNLFETASELLNLQRKKIVIAETITGGDIYKELSLIDNNNIEETYLFNNFDNAIKHIKIDNNVINTYGKYSVNTIYELSNSLLEGSTADLVVFTLGDINSDCCYMAVGDMDGIHVYKNKINVKDDSMIENLTKTAIFYLIRKLKQNNLQFV
ncbi:MAG: hypothetical protein E7345_00220 [Clostridiales bacterium]|nr:hypothetical protein [Clostridiales bacterium]